MNLHQHYRRFRASGLVALDAMRSARTAVAWEQAEDEGLVRLHAEPDEEMFDDSYIDTWTDVSEARRERARKELWAKIERDGVWNICAQILIDDEWTTVGAVCAFVGDDWKGSGYDTDLMREALDALDEMRTEEAEELAARPTFAGVA